MTDGIDGVKPFRVMVRNAISEEIREYALPVDAAVMITDLVDWIAEMEPSRMIETGAFRGRLQAAIQGSTAGFVGEFLEIRRLSPTPPEPEPIAVIQPRKPVVVTGSVYHAEDCGCPVCVPGA